MEYLSIEELEAQGVPRYWVERLDPKVSLDWCDRLRISEADARKVYRAWRDDHERNDRLHAAHRQYLRERDEDRQAVGRRAYARGLEKATKAERNAPRTPGDFSPTSPAPSPSAYEAARQAQFEALAKFDAKSPEQSIEEFGRKLKVRV